MLNISALILDFLNHAPCPPPWIKCLLWSEAVLCNLTRAELSHIAIRCNTEDYDACHNDTTIDSTITSTSLTLEDSLFDNTTEQQPWSLSSTDDFVNKTSYFISETTTAIAMTSAADTPVPRQSISDECTSSDVTCISSLTVVLFLLLVAVLVLAYLFKTKKLKMPTIRKPKLLKQLGRSAIPLRNINN